MVQTLTQELAEILGVRPEDIAPDVTFAEQGIAATDLRLLAKRVAIRTGRPAPELHWGGATLTTLAERFQDRSAEDVFAQLGFLPGLPDAMYYE